MTLAQPRLSYDYPERLPVAVVGAGEYCARNILPCLRYLPVDLVAMAEADRRRGMHVARQFGAQRFYPDYETLLDKEDVKAVIVSLPSAASAASPYPAVAAAALASGAHVWADAPAAGAVTDITKQYTDAAIKGRVYLMAGYRRPFMPGYAALRATIESARLKPTAYALWCALPDQAATEAADPGVDLAARLTHPLALLLDLFGEPKSLQWVWHPEQNGAAVIQTYASGLVGTVQLVSAPGAWPSETLQVQAGGVSFAVSDGVELMQVDAHLAMPAGAVPAGMLRRRPGGATGDAVGLEASGYLGSLRLFCESLLAGKPLPRMNIMQLLHLMNVQASLRTGRERQWVSL